MKTLKNWIIIAGNGRNTGKTTLACQIIEHNKNRGVIGIKISPHQHPLSGSENILFSTKDYSITREAKTGNKDSSRMLMAGASEVFYVQCADSVLDEVLVYLEELTSGKPVVCESGGLRRIVSPSIFIMAMSENRQSKSSVRTNLAFDPLVTDLEKIIAKKAGHAFYFNNNEWKQLNSYDTV